MAEHATPAAEGQAPAPTGTAAPATPQAQPITPAVSPTLAKELAPEANPEKLTLTAAELQSLKDQAVTQALKTREANAAAKQAEADAEVERQRLIAAGEFDAVKADYERQLQEKDQRMKDLAIGNALNAVALKAGIQKVDDLALLSPDTRAACIDDKGEIIGAKVVEAIEALKSDRPYLFAAAAETVQQIPQPQGAPTPGVQSPANPGIEIALDANTIMQNRAKRMEEIRNPKPAAAPGLDVLALMARKG